MVFSGYQLGIHLLNSTISKVSFDRRAVIEQHKPVSISEARLIPAKRTRNSTFITTGPFGSTESTYVVKQPSFNEASLLSSLRNEAYILRLLQAAGITQADTFVGFDEFQNLLFQRKLDGQALSTNALPATATLIALATQLGPLLSAVHALNDQKVSEGKWPNQFGYRKPLLLVLTIRDLTDILSGNPTPNQQEVIDRLINSDYDLLKTIQACTWQQNALIHYDFKLAHLLLDANETINGLIDWEMADLGDVHWDLATVWYEFLQPFMITSRPVETLYRESLEPFNQLLSSYQFAGPIDVHKLRQFLGMVIFQKTFYGTLGDSLELQRALHWLDLAERLLTGSATNNLPDPIPSKPQQYSISLAEPPACAPQPEVRPHSQKGTLREIDELVATLIRRRLDILAMNISLRDYIYRWYNGNLGRQPETTDKAEVAKAPRAGTEILLEDYWWRVEAVSANNNLTIRKGSFRRMATPGTFVYLSHDARNAQKGISSYVKHVFPNFIVRSNDAREDRNDLWTNGQLLIAQDFANWVRFYFNLKGDFNGINLFIDTLSAKLNERQILFQLKLRNSLASYTRTDSAILFMHRQHTNAAFESIAYTYHLLAKAGYIDITASPRLTKQVKGFGGLSYAENPPFPTKSFGTWRADLIAEAVGDDFLKTEPPADVPIDEQQLALKQRIIKRFQDENFNVYELYRNPFPAENEFKFRLDRLADKLKNTALLDVGLGTSITFLPQQRFLKAARDVGFTICREAIWYGNSCTWFCFKIDEDGQRLFATADTGERLGIALFLAQLALLCPQESIFRECLHGCVLGLPATLENAIDEIVRMLDDESGWVPITNQSIDYKVIRAILYGSPTLTDLQRVTPLAEALLEKYINRRMPFPNGYVSTEMDLVASEFSPTLTHGLAALGYFFLLFAGNPNRPIISLSAIYNINSLVNELTEWKNNAFWQTYQSLI